MTKIVQIAVIPESDRLYPALALLGDDGAVRIVSIKKEAEPPFWWDLKITIPEGQ